MHPVFVREEEVAGVVEGPSLPAHGPGIVLVYVLLPTALF